MSLNNPSFPPPGDEINEPVPFQSTREAHSYFLRTGGGLTAVVIILAALAGVITWLMTNYAKQFYDNVSSGQNDLCNFYTCSVEDKECGFYPFTVDLAGNKTCLTEK